MSDGFQIVYPARFLRLLNRGIEVSMYAVEGPGQLALRVGKEERILTHDEARVLIGDLQRAIDWIDQ
jgi:hypothetical protein